MRLRLLLVPSLALMLLACSAPPSSAPPGQTTGTAHTQDQSAPSPGAHDAGADDQTRAPISADAPPASATESAEHADGDTPIIGIIRTPGSGQDAAGVDFSCQTDADCAIKNVGNCCGYYPACVNIDSPTFPEQVQAECAASGLSGICGFPSLTGCQCVDKRCEGVTGTASGEVSIK